MNYIHQLKRGIAIRDAQLRTIDQSVNEFRAFLNGPKFTGGDVNAERKDWIATGDVINWLRESMSASIIAGENAAASWTNTPNTDCL